MVEGPVARRWLGRGSSAREERILRLTRRRPTPHPAPAAHRLLPFPAAPTPLGPPPSIPDAGGNPKAATGAASPAPHALQQQVGGGAGPEFDGMRLMMTSPAGCAVPAGGRLVTGTWFRSSC